MATLALNVNYRLYFNATSYPLCAGTQNGSKTAAIYLCGLGFPNATNGEDQWQLVQIPSTGNYGLRSQMLGDFSLLATFVGSGDNQPTGLRVEFEQETTDFPLQTEWTLTPVSTGSNAFFMTNAANSSDYYMSNNQGYVYMADLGTTSPPASQAWTFAKVSSSSSTTASPSASSSTSATASFTSTSATSAPVNSSSSSDNHSLSAGTIAGILIGSVCAVLLAALLLVLLRRKRGRRTPSHTAESQPALQEERSMESSIGKPKEMYTDAQVVYEKPATWQRPPVEML